MVRKKQRKAGRRRRGQEKNGEGDRRETSRKRTTVPALHKPVLLGWL